ncbi:trypsin beta-like [Episyrphus balteatus]|uniref:trypsin beta-like n=1 Tax=Episyrphus balteatus TaxID=286459 RepID=UPI0024868A1E|nr:trypsin beta-like [Episyrphus balteatus]
MFKFVVLVSLIACALGAAIPEDGSIPEETPDLVEPIPDGLVVLPQLDGRIVGGQDASISKYPYQISLQRSGSHSCGGSLYSNRVVVTAAHCLQNVAASSLKVRVGSTQWNNGGALVGVASFKNHPNYNSRTMVNDIAIIHLSSAVSLNSNVRTIALASSAPAHGTSAVVTGWGTRSSGASSIPATLQQVNVKIVSRAQCGSSSYSYGSSQIRETMICAAAPGKDSCQGDSGGPLVANGVQVGVVSWGYGCAQSNYPGVYSDVAALRSWVQSNA